MATTPGVTIGARHRTPAQPMTADRAVVSGLTTGRRAYWAWLGATAWSGVLIAAQYGYGWGHALGWW